MGSTFHWRAHYAAQVLRNQGVIAHPTEAVWGLACDPFSEAAVNQLLHLKGRPVDKGLILISGNVRHFDALLAPLSQDLQARIMSPMSRPTTWIVPDAEKQIPSWIRGEHDSVAIRISQHPLVGLLSHYFRGALVSTSANPSGSKPAMSVNDIRRYFSAELGCIVPGLLGGATRPSQIIDLVSGKVLRE